MSSLPHYAQPALGNSIAFPRESPAALLKRLSAIPKLAVTAASQLDVRPVAERVSCGIAAMDALTGGLPRGSLSEICGSASSGRTSVLLAALAAATQRQEACALVDATDAFDPLSATAAGVDFARLLWVRCGIKPQTPREHGKQKFQDYLEQALRVTDLLLQSSGFGMVAIDLGDVPFRAARRIPLASWFRFQRAVENTPTVLFVIAGTPLAQTCASLLLELRSSRKCSLSASKNSPSHTELLDEISVEGALLRSRLERKPAQPVTAEFLTKTGS